MDPTPGTLLGGKYRLEQPLASGGMGSIWKARHVELDTLVAVKLIGWLRSLQAPVVERFRREARLCAQIRSVHVVHISDYGVENGVPYMVMELLDGEDLEHFVESSGPLSLDRTLEIVRPVAKALALVHDAGLIHRDIKPANVFLARLGGDEVVKIVDFGIAREESSDQRLTQTSQLMGSPLYMSPEQIGGKPVTRRTDLWSLGLVVFEMLAGQPALSARSLGELHEAIVKNPLPKIADVRPDLAELQPFFDRALARDPDQRFPDAASFLAGLELGAASVPARTKASAPEARTRSLRLVDAETVAAPIPTSNERAMVGTLDPSTGGAPAPTRGKAPFIVAAAGLLALAGGGAWWALRGPAVDASGGAPTASAAPTPEASSPATSPEITVKSAAPAAASDAPASGSAVASTSSTVAGRPPIVTAGGKPRATPSATAQGQANVTATAKPAVTSSPLWGVPVSK